jgi:hypothetical protein
MVTCHHLWRLMMVMVENHGCIFGSGSLVCGLLLSPSQDEAVVVQATSCDWLVLTVRSVHVGASRVVLKAAADALQ